MYITYINIYVYIDITIHNASILCHTSDKVLPTSAIKMAPPSSTPYTLHKLITHYKYIGQGRCGRVCTAIYTATRCNTLCGTLATNCNQYLPSRLHLRP